MICWYLCKVEPFLIDATHWKDVESYQWKEQAKEIHQLDGIVQSNQAHMHSDSET